MLLPIVLRNLIQIIQFQFRRQDLAYSVIRIQILHNKKIDNQLKL